MWFLDSRHAIVNYRQNSIMIHKSLRRPITTVVVWRGIQSLAVVKRNGGFNGLHVSLWNIFHRTFTMFTGRSRMP